MKLASIFPELETQRLFLRPLKLSDSSAWFEIFSDARVMHYWSREPIKSLAESEALLQQELDWFESDSNISWGIALAESNRIIGKITLFQFNEQNSRAEIGYMLGHEHWGKGYMYEAMKAVIDYAFNKLELHRIEADTDPENLASLAILEKFGFQREGYFQERWWVHGQWADSVMLALLNRP
jgi:ribosomal-protein-alanine N-acetyltransferase